LLNWIKSIHDDNREVYLPPDFTPIASFSYLFYAPTYTQLPLSEGGVSLSFGPSVKRVPCIQRGSKTDSAYTAVGG